MCACKEFFLRGRAPLSESPSTFLSDIRQSAYRCVVKGVRLPPRELQ